MSGPDARRVCGNSSLSEGMRAQFLDSGRNRCRVAVRILLGGSVMVETVFSIPGMGRLLVDSIAFRDYTVIQALLLLFATEFILINLIVDLLYGVLNPKIRYASK